MRPLKELFQNCPSSNKLYHSYKEGRGCVFCLIICRHSRGIASTMLIKLKYSIGDRFAFNTLTPFRKIPASEKRSTIVMIPLENKPFLNMKRCSTVISLLFQITCWTTSSYDETADWFSTGQASKHSL